MHQKLYGNRIESACAYCRHGKRTADGRAVLCMHKGVVPLYHHCRHYEYDPLRRIPAAAPPMQTHTEDEFFLD